MTDATPNPNLRIKALELANQHTAAPADVVTRANHYHAFLNPAAAGGATAGAVNPNPKTAAVGASGGTGATGAKAPTTTVKKPAAGTKKNAAGPAGDTKGPGGEFTQDQVRALVRDVATKCGKQEALDILDAEAHVANVSAVKPEDYDKVAEACNNALGGDGAEATGDDEADPLA